MRPIHLSMTNFMPYAQPTELDLSSLHLACLAGENGHGKSAIIDAITWALWGQARARRDDELIHLGEEQMEVRLDFQLGDEQYRVIRQRDSAGRGNSTLEFQVGSNGHWSPLTGDTMRETQEIIDSTIHMDYDTFINSALLLQGRADEFSNQPPGKRKEILAQILNLGVWEVLEERAKQHVREAEGQLTAIASKAEVMRGDLERLPDYEAALEMAAGEAQRLGAELEEAQQVLSQVKEKAAELGFQRQGLADLEREIEVRKQEVAAIQRRISETDSSKLAACAVELDDIRARLAGVEELPAEGESMEEKEIARLTALSATLKARNDGLKADMDALREEMNLLEQAGAACPVCDSELTEEHRGEILAQKQTEGESKATQFRENAATIKDAEHNLQRWQQQWAERKQSVTQGNRLRVQESELLGKIAQLQAQEQRVAEWQEQETALREGIVENEFRQKEMQAEVRNLQLLAAGADEARRQVDRLGDEVSRANLRVGAATQQIDHCQYLRGEAEKLEAQQAEETAKKATYDELRKAFGKRGIQAMIIETVLPEIEENANELLARMSDGRMSVSFESQRETKKGDIAETLDIQVSDELGVRSYDLFSGGERFRLDFAIRIAISKLLARRAGARLQTLIMDEGFGSQDASGRDRLVEAIQSVAGDFELILVVTHIDELREAFPNRIEVVKGPAGSLISVN